MALLQTLRSLVNERLSAAAEEIFGTVGQIVTEYEDEALSLKQELDHKSRLLEMFLKPYMTFYGADIIHPPLFKEGVYPEQQNMKSSLVQEEPQPPQIKEEQEELPLRPDEGLILLAVKSEDVGENRETAAVTFASAEHTEITDANDCAAQPLCKVHISTEQQEKNDCLFKVELEPIQIKEERQELLQKPEAGLTAITQHEQNMNSSLVQEKPQPPHIKEEQEELLIRPDEGLTLQAVKREDDGENREKEPVAITSADLMKLQTGVEEYAPQPTSDSHRSESDTEDSDEWEETKEYHPANMEGQSLSLSKKLTQDPRSPKQVKRHTEKNVFNCKDCDKKFNSKAILKFHTMTHTGEYPFNCTVCGKGCSTKHNLKSHTMTHTGEKPYTCTICGNGFTLKGGLKTHMMTHTGEKPFSCTVCGKGFSLKADLKRHMMTHTGEKPFTCTVCGNGFSQMAVLKTHIRTHTGEKPFTCTVCGKGFSQTGDLKKHMRTHTGEYPFNCTVCGKGCSLKGDLKTHIRTHTGEKPFTCKFCGKGFSQKGSLNKHIMSHTGDTPFTCTVCGKGFSHNGNLNKHMRTHTEGEHEPMEI